MPFEADAKPKVKQLRDVQNADPTEGQFQIYVSGNTRYEPKSVNDLTVDGSPDGAADYVMTWDADAGAPKKVLLDNLPSGGGTSPGGSSGELQYNNAGSFGAVTGSSVSGSDVTFAGNVQVGDSGVGVIRLGGTTSDKSLHVTADGSSIAFQSYNNTPITFNSLGGGAVTCSTQWTFSGGVGDLGISVAFGNGSGGGAGGLTYDKSVDGAKLQSYGSKPIILQNAGNGVLLGTTTNPSGSNNKSLTFGDNVGDPTPGSNTCAIYGKDVSTVVEFFAIDEGGTASQLTPHAKDAPPGIYNLTPGIESVLGSSNIYRGEIRWRNLEDTSKPVVVETFADYNTRRGLYPGDPGYKEPVDWDANQQSQVDRRAQEQAKWDEQKAAATEQFREELANWRALPSWRRAQQPMPAYQPPNNERPKAYTPKPKPAFLEAA